MAAEWPFTTRSQALFLSPCPGHSGQLRGQLWSMKFKGCCLEGGILRKLSLPLLGALSLLLLFVLSEVKMAGATEAYCNYEAIP